MIWESWFCSMVGSFCLSLLAGNFLLIIMLKKWESYRYNLIGTMQQELATRNIRKEQNPDKTKQGYRPISNDLREEVGQYWKTYGFDSKIIELTEQIGPWCSASDEVVLQEQAREMRKSV